MKYSEKKPLSADLPCFLGEREFYASILVLAVASVVEGRNTGYLIHKHCPSTDLEDPPEQTLNTSALELPLNLDQNSEIYIYLQQPNKIPFSQDLLRALSQHKLIQR